MNRVDAYPFADLALARRFERGEALANVDFVNGRALAFPESRAEWMELGGTYAMFDGPTSPATQTFALGMSEPVTEASLDELEDFFLSRGAQVFHEVCPHADASAPTLLSERGYQPIEFSNVLYRPIVRDLRLIAGSSKTIKIRAIDPHEHELWARTAALGWSAFEGLGEFMQQLG